MTTCVRNLTDAVARLVSIKLRFLVYCSNSKSKHITNNAIQQYSKSHKTQSQRARH